MLREYIWRMTARLYDALNFFSKLTWKRAVNGAAVISSYYFSRWFGSTKPRGLPFSIAFEPTTACNLGCPECPSGLKQFTRPTGNLKVDFFDKAIDELAPTTAYITFYFQGEPFINPRFLEMVQMATSKRIYTTTSTNAHFLHPGLAKKTVESGLDRLIISIDGTTQEVYEQYRREGELNKVLEGTRNIIEWKHKLKSRTPHVIWQFLVVRPNEHQIYEVKRMGKEFGVDEVRYKTAQVYDYENGNPLIPTIEKYARYKQCKDGKWKVKNPLDDHCWKMWHSCVITWDGRVIPCCFDKDATHQLGQLGEQSFGELWYGERYAAFRKSLMKSRKEIDICANCSEGTKVWA